MSAPARPRVCIVQPGPCSPSETFLEAHAAHLPARVTVLHTTTMTLGGRPLVSRAWAARALRRAVRSALRRSRAEAETAVLVKAFRACRPEAVLAEYGDTGVGVMEACRRADVPLVVHFHGYDASLRAQLEALADAYRPLFHQAAAVVAVSRAMRARLIALGAPAEKVHYNPYGVDCAQFAGAAPAEAPPVFLAVGRFTAKKAPQLTLRAFAEVHRALPEARLRMIGFGPLQEACFELARELGIDRAVAFLGPCPPAVVRAEMRRARCFVQHSVQAPDGDAEGTPVAILEAGAAGLPVVATRHGGIPDVVADGRTGLLVAEQDVRGMAAGMLRLAREPALAGQFGAAARRRVVAEFSLEERLGRLGALIESCIRAHRAARPS
jgi:glycosyltransferase involved in cell wall biosynthesis